MEFFFSGYSYEVANLPVKSSMDRAVTPGQADLPVEVSISQVKNCYFARTSYSCLEEKLRQICQTDTHAHHGPKRIQTGTLKVSQQYHVEVLAKLFQLIMKMMSLFDDQYLLPDKVAQYILWLQRAGLELR